MSTPHPFRRHASVVVFASSAAWGCAATGGDPAFWDPVPGAGSGDAATSGASAGAGGAALSGARLELAFTTVSFGGEYAPDNVGAAWITDDGGAFVKTLEVWAAKRVRYLARWRDVSGENIVDAITGASWSGHGAHELVWDMTDTAGREVPNGTYRVNLEFTERNGSGPFVDHAFTKSSQASTSTPADTPYFAAQRLGFTP
jgi:hypothetical protein